MAMGVDGGCTRATGASDGLVRTRLRPTFQSVLLSGCVSFNNPALGIIDSVCRHVRCGMIFFFAGLRSLAWMVRRPGVQRVLDTTWLRLVVRVQWFGGVQTNGSCLGVAPDDKLVSVLGRSFENTPSILPVRGHLDSIKCLMKGDLYTGRGYRQRGLSCSQFANPYKVAKFGRSRAIELFSTFLQDNAQLRSALWTLSGLRLVCHCGPQQPCHADILLSAYSHSFAGAFDRDESHSGVPPTSDQFNYLAELREEHDSSEGSTADEDADPSGSG